MSWARRRGAPRWAGGDSPPAIVFWFGEMGNRGGGKVGNLFLVFHFSIRPRRRSCGNVGISPACGEISKGLVERVGSLSLAFHSFHSPGISTALRWLCSQRGLPAGAAKSAITASSTARISAGEIASRPEFGAGPVRAFAAANPRLAGALAIPAVFPIRDGTGHKSSLLSRISSLNCQPSKLINMRPNSCQVISRPSTLRSGTEPSWESSHSSLPRTTR